MISDFRLVSEVRAFILKSSSIIYLVSPDDKLALTKVRKKIKESTSPVSEFQVLADGIKVKIGENKTLLIKSSEFPKNKEDNWYKLGNASEECIWDIARYVNLNNGETIDTDFSIAVPSITTPNSDDGVKLISVVMPYYEDYMNELARRLNFKFKKKTRKYIPGHRYDTEEKTYYCLGTVYSRVNNTMKDNFMVFPEKEVTLFTEHIGDCKKLSEVFKSGYLSESIIENDKVDNYIKIQPIYSKESMADCGEVLIADSTLHENLEVILDNSISLFETKCLDKYINGAPYLTFILNVFRYTDKEGLDFEYPDTILEKLTGIMKTCLLKQTLYLWNSNTGRSMNSSIDAETNYTNCFTALVNNIQDKNIKKFSYYENLFNHLGINLREELDKILKSEEIGKLSTDLDYHLKYDKGVNYTSSLRTTLSSNYQLSIVEVSKVIDSDPLVEVIKELCLIARENQGISIEHYSIGTASRAKIGFETFGIHINNIIDYYKEKGIEIPENLKEGILKSSFKSIYIAVDKGGDIK